MEAPDHEVLHGELDLLGGELDGVAVEPLPSHVAQDVDAAELPGPGPVEHVDLVLVRDVAHHRKGLPANASIVAAVSSMPAASMSASSRSAPYSAKPIDIARPIPRAAPDTTATRSGQVEQIVSHVMSPSGAYAVDDVRELLTPDRGGHGVGDTRAQRAAGRLADRRDVGR